MVELNSSMNLLISRGGTDWELRNFLCHCLDKSQAPFVNNKTPCNKPGGNVSNLGNNLSNKNWTSGRAGVHFRFCSFKFSHLLVFVPYGSVVKFVFLGEILAII